MKQAVKRTPWYHPLRNWSTRRRHARELREWENSGKPLPPPHVFKQRALREHAQRFGLKVLVETGTYYGDMLEAMKGSFDRLYSIELSTALHRQARQRFRRDRQIELIQGDSGAELGKLMPKIRQPSLFWLDGHYSGGETAKGTRDTPIYDELKHIFASGERRHVILIDDARMFGTDPEYPSIEQLTGFVHSHWPGAEVSVADDSIRVTPANAGHA